MKKLTRYLADGEALLASTGNRTLANGLKTVLQIMFPDEELLKIDYEAQVSKAITSWEKDGGKREGGSPTKRARTTEKSKKV